MIDTHCHIYTPEKFPPIEELVSRCQAVNVTQMIVIGIDYETNLQSLELAESHSCITFTVGCHPNHAANFDEKLRAQILELSQHPKCVGIGETGLDYYWDHATKEQQMVALDFQVELARKIGKPVVFHCREANQDFIAYLESHELGAAVWHCFSGSEEDAERASAQGLYFGIDGPITYPKNSDLRSVVAMLPRDRILLETDSPYMAPVPYRGKSNSPEYLPHICVQLAEVLQISPSECDLLTTENAQRLFRFPAARED